MTSNHGHSRAILLALAGFSLWCLNDAAFKLGAEQHIPAHELAGCFGFFFSLLIVVKLAVRQELGRLRPKRPLPVLARGLLMTGTTVCNILAFPHLPLTAFYVTVFTTPFLVALLAALVLREPLSIGKTAAILAGFSGVVVAINPFVAFGNGGDYLGYVFAFLGVLQFAVAQIILRARAQDETTESLVLSARALLVVYGLVLSLSHYVPLTGNVVALMFLAGLVCIAADTCMVGAMRAAPATTIAPFHYSQLLTGALLGYFIWHDVPTWHLGAGALIIVAAGLYIAQAARKEQAAAAIQAEL